MVSVRDTMKARTRYSIAYTLALIIAASSAAPDAGIASACAHVDTEHAHTWSAAGNDHFDVHIIVKDWYDKRMAWMRSHRCKTMQHLALLAWHFSHQAHMRP